MSFDRRPDFRSKALADRWARRRHGGRGHSQRPSPSRFRGHLIGRSSWSAPAADPGGGLNQYT